MPVEVPDPVRERLSLDGRSPIPQVDAIVEIGVLHDVVVFDREGIISERSSSFPGVESLK